MGPPGHIAIALGAKPAAPKVPLWILMVATEVLDLLCFGLLAAGIERGGPDPWFPWSHGLFMSAVLSAAAGAVAFGFLKEGRTSIVIGLLVLSHWVMDFISHPPHLPLLFEGPPLVGLGLEDTLATGIIMEFSLLAVGVAIYAAWRKRKPADRPSA